MTRPDPNRPDSCPENVWAAATKAEREFILKFEELHLVFRNTRVPPLTCEEHLHWHEASKAYVEAIVGESALSRVKPDHDGGRIKWRHAKVAGRPRDVIDTFPNAKRTTDLPDWTKK